MVLIRHGPWTFAKCGLCGNKRLVENMTAVGKGYLCMVCMDKACHVCRGKKKR